MTPPHPKRKLVTSYVYIIHNHIHGDHPYARLQKSFTTAAEADRSLFNDLNQAIVDFLHYLLEFDPQQQTLVDLEPYVQDIDRFEIRDGQLSLKQYDFHCNLADAKAEMKFLVENNPEHSEDGEPVFQIVEECEMDFTITTVGKRPRNV
jgi:hypothetical protein